MKQLLLVALVVIMLSSCSSEERAAENGTVEESINSGETAENETQREQTDPATDSLAFNMAFNRFFTALQNSDTATINRFIHPAYGLWVIEQPGAMPKMTLVSDINKFKREYQDRSFFTIADEMKACNLKEETWPTFDCADMNYDEGKSGYSKDGCFVSGPGKFVKSGYWNYADLPLTQIKRIQTTLPRISKSVLHTNTSFEFHFGYVDNHWRLLFAKLIYPCSA